MVSSRIGAKVGVAAGVGAVVSAFGIVTPAQAYTCDITINPTEDALRAAIDNGNTVVCINAGTLDMGLLARPDNDPILIDTDVTLVGLGEVIVDGNDEAPAFIVGWSNGANEIDLTIDNLTVQNFHDWDYNDYYWGMTKVVPVVGFAQDTFGTLTVLNSQFIGNSSYVSIVGAVDQDGMGDYFGDIVIDNTVFSNNESNYGSVWGYGDITVTDSTFSSNYGFGGASAIEQWSTDDTWETSGAIISGNYFEYNQASSSTVDLSSSGGSIYNNTFVNNFSNSQYLGSAITAGMESAFVIAYNTFIDNDSDYEVANVNGDTAAELTFTGNIFSTLDDEIGVDVNGLAVSDRGGNFSTADDSAAFDHEKSQINVDSADLGLAAPADNGGSTWTSALGDGSIAMNVMSMTDVANELGPDLAWDQRGEARGSLVDSGAWDDGNDGQLAETGVDATGIALTGGLLGAAGVAFITRRRTA